MNDDSRLILELNASSKKAFTQIYHKYIGMVVGFTTSVLKDKSLSEDVAQYCFMQLWDRRESISTERNLPAWLYVIAKNAVIKELQRQERACRFADYILGLGENSSVQQSEIDSQKLRSVILEVISDLPEARRKIFEMKVMDELSCPEIAAKLGLSVKTVETQIARSRKAILERISKLIG